MGEFESLLDSDLELIIPKMYKVILHNDDYSTFDFVVEVLMKVFNKSLEEAQRLTIEVDSKGLAIVGVYVKDIAETKVEQVKKMAKEAKYPLRATYEEE